MDPPGESTRGPRRGQDILPNLKDTGAETDTVAFFTAALPPSLQIQVMQIPRGGPTGFPEGFLPRAPPGLFPKRVPRGSPVGSPWGLPQGIRLGNSPGGPLVGSSRA